MKALNPFAAEWYTPAEDKESENPTRFKIRGLNGSQVGYVQPEMILGVNDEGTPMLTGLTGKGVDVTLNLGLVDWENFANDFGSVKFSQHNFGLIDVKTRTELALQIIAKSFATAEEKKTSP